MPGGGGSHVGGFGESVWGYGGGAVWVVPGCRNRGLAEGIVFGERFRRIGWRRWSIFWDGWRSIRSRGLPDGEDRKALNAIEVGIAGDESGAQGEGGRGDP